jgi:hypothetical protein
LPVPQTLEEASDRVWKDLRSQALEKVKSANLTYLRARAEVVVTPDYAALSDHAP